MAIQQKKLSDADVTRITSPASGDLILLERDGIANALDIGTMFSAYTYPSRADAVAADVSAVVLLINVVTPSGRVLAYARDASGTALSTNSGTVNWSPAGNAFPDHFADNTTPGTTDMRTAMNAADSYSANIYFFATEYFSGSNVRLDASCHMPDGARIIAGDGAKVTMNGGVIAAETSHIFAWVGTGYFSIPWMKSVFVNWFGALNDAATDASDAVQMAYDSLSTGQVVFSRGTYVVAKKCTFSDDDKGLVADQHSVTKIVKKILDDDLFYFTSPSPTTTALRGNFVRNLTFPIDTADIHTAGAHIKTNVTLDFGMSNVYTENGWNGVIHVLARQIVMNDVYIETTSSNPAASNIGLGFHDLNGAASRQAVGNFTGVKVRNASTTTVERFQINIDIGAADGFWFTGCYSGNAALSNLHVEPQLSDSQLTGVKWVNGWFDPVRTAAGRNIVVTGETTDAFSSIDISHNRINGGQDAESAIELSPTGTELLDFVKFQGNLISNFLGRALHVKPDATARVLNLSFSGNTIRNCQIDGAGAESFIEADYMDSPIFSGNIIAWDDPFGRPLATSNADYAITLGANTDFVTMIGNAVYGHTVGGINNNSTGTNNLIHSNNGEDDPVQPFIDNLNQYLPRLADRPAFVTWAAANDLPDGAVVAVGGVQYEADSTSTAISDLTGWIPFGDVTPLHWGAPRDGVSDDTTAIAAAVAYWQGTVFGTQFANGTDRALYFPGGPYYSTSGMVIATSGTGQVIYGDGQQVTRLIGIEVNIKDRHCSARGMSLSGAGENGIRLSNSNRRYASLRDLHVRDKTYGLHLEGGADDTATDCIFEKNKYNLHSPDGAVASSGDFELTSCKFLSATVNNIYAPDRELKFSNCVQGNAASVGMLIKARNGGAQSSVECYFSQMTNTIQQMSAFFDITAVADAGGGDVTITAANTFTAGESIDVFGTTSYNGTHTVVSATDTAFVVTAAFVASETGVTRRIHDRVWRVTGVTDAGGGNIEITTDGNHDLVPKLTGLVISGTTSYDATYDVVDVTGPAKFVVAATFVASETGVAAMINWDVVIDGEGTIGRVNDMFFTGGNTNYIKIKDANNITFTGTRLKQQIWLAGDNDRIMINRSRRGRSSDPGSLSDIPIGGTTSHTGWSEVASSDLDNIAGNDSTSLVLATPNLASGVGVDNLPTMNEVRVATDGVSHVVAGRTVFDTDDEGIKVLTTSPGSTLTIASGAITPTNTMHRLLGEGSASDNLTSIANGAYSGQILILKNISNAATINVLKDQAARMKGNFTLNSTRCVLGLLWADGAWNEIFRSSNSVAQSEKIGSLAVADLTSLIGVSTSDMIYCTDLRVFDGAGVLEGAGAGTGGLVSRSSLGWVIVGTNIAAVA